MHESFLLKLFFAGRLPAGGLATLLDSRIAAASQQLTVLRAVAGRTTVTPDTFLAAATLENGIRHVAAELAWLHDLRADADNPAAAAARLTSSLPLPLPSSHSEGEAP